MTESSDWTKKHMLREARQLAFDEMFRVPQAEHSLAIDHSFPEQFVDELSRQEVFNKHLFRPNTYLHKWWARRCGTTFRAILYRFMTGKIDTQGEVQYTRAQFEFAWIHQE